MAAKKKKSKLDELFSLSPEETAKRTKQFVKGYLAHKTEDWRSAYAHPEYMEGAEHYANEIKRIQIQKMIDEGDN